VNTGAVFDGNGDYVNITESPELYIGTSDYSVCFRQKSNGDDDWEVRSYG